jgi:hypothetical protein
VAPAETIERERRWALPAALATLAAVALFVTSVVVLSSKFGGASDAAHLRDIDQDSGTFVFLNVLQGAGAALLAAPLAYLFQAGDARSDAMRSQLIGLVIAGPLFLAVATIVNAVVLHDAAPDFVARGIAGSGDHADEVARNVVADQSLRGLGIGFGIGGALGFVLGTAYSCLYGLRTGLLTRFWGSLGMALAVVSLLPQFFEFILLWFIYLGLLIAGWVPGGRPPAWAAGKAIPWPTPGEQAAESLAGGDDGGGGEGSAPPPNERGERRKRKRRR